MCTYHSPMFLLPPHDLIQLAVCLREWNHVEVALLDAIASKYSEERTLAFIKDQNPDMLVALTGIETFGEDMACLDRIKAAFPALTLAVFGYYPTCFPEEVLQKSGADFVLRREPEYPLSQCVAAIHQGLAPDTVAGLAGRRQDRSIFANPDARIQQLDQLPLPDYGLVDITRYEESFFGVPCGAILSARGCPHPCSYCTTTYGRHLVMKSPESVIAEIENLQQSGIRFVRFLDDTFTINKDRVIAICRGMRDRGIAIPWSCLARVDTLDAEMLEWMARAGCKRILVGIESYSPRVLQHLQKRLDPTRINAQLAPIRKAGIQALGFFMIGGPIETDEDFEDTLRGALEAPLDFIYITPMTPYAGTPFFNALREQIDFTLLPYTCTFKDAALPGIAHKRSRRLYMRFYLRPRVLAHHSFTVLRHPLRTMRLLWTYIGQ